MTDVSAIPSGLDQCVEVDAITHEIVCVCVCGGGVVTIHRLMALRVNMQVTQSDMSREICQI